jgi:hypothetical protein
MFSPVLIIPEGHRRGLDTASRHFYYFARKTEIPITFIQEKACRQTNDLPPG